jgi:NitT/TauT family transport system permease protein
MAPAGRSRSWAAPAFWAALLAAWEVASRVPGASVISPLSLLGMMAGRLADGAFLLDIALSLKRMIVGYAWVVLVGISGGLVLGRVNWVHEAFGGLVVASQAMPGAIWVPVATFFFGLTERAIIFAIVLGGTGVVLLNTDTGVRNVSPVFVQAARVLGARGWRLLWYVIVPAAVPKILDGLRLAWAFGWRALMASELIITIGGFGRRINDVVKSRDLTELFVLVAVIGVIGYCVDQFVFRTIERNVHEKWGLETR